MEKQLLLVLLIIGSVFGQNPLVNQQEKALLPEITVLQVPCACNYPTCSCCAQFALVPQNQLDLGCAELSYDGQDVGIRLRLSVGGQTLFDREISASNPPPACVSPPMFPFIAFCTHLYNIRVEPEGAKACLKLEFQVLDDPVAVLDLQCLQLDASGVNAGVSK